MAKYSTIFCFLALFLALLPGCSTRKSGLHSTSKNSITRALRLFILQKAAWAMQQDPVTVTSDSSERSAGNKHDFFAGQTTRRTLERKTRRDMRRTEPDTGATCIPVSCTG